MNSHEKDLKGKFVMWMLAGLGNPGNKYAFNRHNIGFMIADILAQNLATQNWQNESKALTLKIQWHNQSILLVKPQNYMNRSGEAVQQLMSFYKIPMEKLIVAHDDIDQPFANIKIQKNRGHGGHNGIRNISELLGSADYLRLKLGVGRPPIPQMEVADWVLQNFSSEEMKTMPEFLKVGCEALESIILDGFAKASSLFNGTIDKNRK